MGSRLRLILLGAPGSGKGTMSSRIVNTFKLNHLSSGDILRKHIDNKTDIGLQAKEYVDKGALVPDDFIARIMIGAVKNSENPDWLLDGFPRTVNQAKTLFEAHSQIEGVINLNVPHDEIIRRLKNRWVHKPSGRIYNLEFNPPKVDFKDDVTGEALVQREDDKPDIVLKRLKIYEDATKPILDFYNSKSLLVTFTGNTTDFLWPFVRSHINNLRPVDLQHITTRTHTGQQFSETDFRDSRYPDENKLVNTRWAINLIKEDPVVVCDRRVVWSNSGGALGNPKVYINLDRPKVHVCGYSGRKFIQKKYYDEKVHGKSISFEEYLKQMGAAA